MAFPAIAAGAFFKKFWPYFAVAGIVALLLTLTYCSGKSAGKADEVIEQQDRELEVQEDLGKANEGAAGQRVEDEVQTEQERRELQDALKATDDPDRQRAQRGCVILRQQGRDTSRFPACR